MVLLFFDGAPCLAPEDPAAAVAAAYHFCISNQWCCW